MWRDVGRCVAYAIRATGYRGGHRYRRGTGDHPTRSLGLAHHADEAGLDVVCDLVVAGGETVGGGVCLAVVDHVVDHVGEGFGGVGGCCVAHVPKYIHVRVDVNT